MWEGVPSRTPYTQYQDRETEGAYRKNFGKRFPFETWNTKNLIDSGRILNLSAHDPQMWGAVIENWGKIVERCWRDSPLTPDTNQMYLYLESFLGETG